jgi:hypothetical protein
MYPLQPYTSLLRPYVHSKALGLLYGRLYLLWPFATFTVLTPSLELCPLYGPLTQVKALCPPYGPLTSPALCPLYPVCPLYPLYPLVPIRFRTVLYKPH